MLDIAGLNAFIGEHFTRSAFRLETHQQLDVASDQDYVGRYLRGEPLPSLDSWLAHLRDEVARGLTRYKVHAVHEPLSDYLRYACEWGYQSTTEAGERIRIADASEHDLGGQDFWLLDEQHVLLMHYDNGRFAGAEPVEPEATGAWLDLARRAWDLGTDFHDWWRDHPQYWRANVPTPRNADDHTPAPARNRAASTP